MEGRKILAIQNFIMKIIDNNDLEKNLIFGHEILYNIVESLEPMLFDF